MMIRTKMVQEFIIKALELIKLERLQSDRGSNYMSEFFDDYLQSTQCILHYLPGVCKGDQRSRRTPHRHDFRDRLRYSLLLSNAPTSFWEYAIVHAASNLNLTLRGAATRNAPLEI